jgi:hypothetical protein
MDAELALYHEHIPVDLHYNILPTLQVLKMLQYTDDDAADYHYRIWLRENVGITPEIDGNGLVSIEYAEALQECFHCDNHAPLVSHYNTIKLFEALFNLVTDLKRTLRLMRVHDFAAAYMGEFSPMRGLAVHALREEAEQAFTDGESNSDDDSSSE